MRTSILPAIALMLAASPGCCIKVSASGSQASDVMMALGALIADKFGEEA